MAKKKTTGESAPKEVTALRKSATAAEERKPTRPVRREVPAEPAVGADSGGSSARRFEVSHERIAERAYGLYVSGVPGSEADHWAQAERELRGHG